MHMSLEEEMTTHSSILAWRIPWTEEPGGLQSMGRKVRHDWATNTTTTICICIGLAKVCLSFSILPDIKTLSSFLAKPVCIWGFPVGSHNKESACNAGDLGLIPGSGRSPGEGNGYPPQYSFLENSMIYLSPFNFSLVESSLKWGE